IPAVGTGPAAYYSYVDGSGRFGNPYQNWYDVNGSYAGSGVPPGTYTIYPAYVSPYQAPAPKTVVLAAGANPALRLVYVFVGTIQGTVADDSGNPLAGVTVCDDAGDCGTSNV